MRWRRLGRAGWGPATLALVVLLAAVPVAVGAGEPTLGVRFAESGVTQGFGAVRPPEISYGGDPTSLVTHVRWQSWGGARAVGHGTADYVWPGFCVACGSEQLPAKVVAFDLTQCDGHSVYEHVEWYFPDRGMTFSPRLTDINLCTGKSSFGNEHFPKCPSFTLAGSSHRIIDILVSGGLRCGATRGFIDSLPVAREIGHSARFRAAGGWYCGTEVEGEQLTDQGFDCERGDFQSVNFLVK